MKLTIKENSKNYTCSVVKIEQVYPIEGADKIHRVVIFGNNVVTSKDVKVGDTMLYFNSGTKLSEDFCKFNNLLDKAELNNDPGKKGFISHKQFRVKAIKLRGVISDGMLMPLNSLDAFHLDFKKDLKPGNEFTDINGISICEKYFVPVRNSNPGGKAPKLPKQTSKLIEGQFYLHNDTDNLRKNIHKLNPNDIISLHYKKHGTSIVVGNVLTKKPLKWYEKLLQKIGVNVVDTEYDIIYSSRKVIKNANTTGGYYGEDIWGVVAKEVGHLIPKNWTLYGEIIGYTQGGAGIQGMYDYGCKVGEHKFYVYKISVVNPDGKVIYLTDKQIEEYCDKVGLLYSDTFIYYGRVKDFTEKFQIITDTNISGGTTLSCQIDKEFDAVEFLRNLELKYNEKDCYMCTNKVPEEGIVLRVEKLEEYEAYKLKSKRFILGESEAQEKGETNLEDN
jgi:RNA ligase (TIGR02306 family)